MSILRWLVNDVLGGVPAALIGLGVALMLVALVFA